jgi:hypothetical protein
MSKWPCAKKEQTPYLNRPRLSIVSLHCTQGLFMSVLDEDRIVQYTYPKILVTFLETNLHSTVYDSFNLCPATAKAAVGL